uniref:PIN domain-containing protein n=1 Tax=Chlorobium chlorochromatii (strain CaD3) TaxID=340177 RepID=Q3ASE1_CHLCH
MSKRVVTDTMAIVLRLEQRKLPQQVRNIFLKAEQEECTIIIPTMVFAEIGYLSERGRIDVTLDDVRTYCTQHPNIVESALTQAIVAHSFTINDIPELHDRLIAGTASYQQLPLLTNDPIITQSQHLTVIW